MKILIITQLYPEPDDIGDNKPTKTVEYFAREWVNAGHQVVVIHCPSKFPLMCYLIPDSLKNKISGLASTMIPSKSSRNPLKREDNGITIYRLPMFKLYPGRAYSDSAMKIASSDIISYLDSIHFKPDLVAGHFANPSTELVALLSRHYRSKSSIVFHRDCTKENIKKYRLTEAVKNINVIGARSIVEAKKVKKILCPHKDVFVCFSGMPNTTVESAEKVCSKHTELDKIEYLFVGSLIPRKRLDAVVEAFAQLVKSKPNVNRHLTIVGGGPEEEKIRKMITEYGISNNVVIQGECSREKVFQLMKKANVFPMISENETFGMVYGEAMLQGCIVVASYRGGFDGIIRNGENGYLCEPGDAKQLTQILTRIESMSLEERNAMGQHAIDTAMNYSEREVALRYLDDVKSRW